MSDEPRIYTICKSRYGRVDLRFAPVGSRHRHCDCREKCAHPDAASSIVGSVTISEAAVAAARAEIVGWLRSQEREWRDVSAELGSSVAGDVAAHYAQAIQNAVASIESGAPQRWAAEREGQGRG